MLKFNDPFAIRCVEQACRVGFKPGRDNCVARFNDEGRLLAGVFYTDFNIVSIQVHVAGFAPNWMDRSLLWVSVDWPYNKLGVNKMIAPVHASNEASLAFCHHFGFTVEARIRDVFPDGDLLVLSLYKSDCRFLGMRPPRLTLEGNKGEDHRGQVIVIPEHERRLC